MRLVFDGFELDPDSCQLFRDGIEVHVERRAMDVLCYLAVRPDQLIRREELLGAVWQAQSLSEGVLASTVSKLRRALGQSPGAREPIETVHGRGYRWRAPARGRASLVVAPASPSAGALATDPFVGRGAVLELFRDRLERAARRSGQLILMTGEAGIGKTRTLAKLAEWAKSLGFSVWSGGAYDGGGAPPYWPWIQIARDAHEELGVDRWRRYLPGNAQALRLLIPDLVASSVDESSSELPWGPSPRFRLFDELTQFVRAASSAGPRLIILDDLQWADAATLELLIHMVRGLNEHAVLCAATLRDYEPSEDTAHRDALKRLGRIATSVPLEGLSLEEVSELVSALTGSTDAEPGLDRALFERTHGNPFFIRQILELSEQRSAPASQVGSTANPVPDPIVDVLQHRLRGISDAAREVLAAAAVVGAEFDANVVAEMLDRSLKDVLVALEPARRRNVVRLVEPYRLRFEHTLLRDCLLDGQPLARLGALHARALHVLTARPQSGDPPHLGEVARHSLSAVPFDLDACIRHCRTAAHAAREASGFEAAVTIVSRLIERVRRERADDRTLAELLLELGVDQFCAGEFDVARRTLWRGAKLARETGHTRLFARFAAKISDWSLPGGNEQSGIRELVEEALEVVGEEAPELRAVLLAQRAERGIELPTEERLALLDRADELAKEQGDPEALLEVAISRVSLRHPTRIAEARAAIERFRSLVKRYPSAAGTPNRIMWSLDLAFVEYCAALACCDLAAADAALLRCRAAADESQMAVHTVLVSAMQAGRALGDGRFEELERDMAELRERSATLRDSTGSAVTVGLLLWRYVDVRVADARGDFSAIDGDLIPAALLSTLGPRLRTVASLWLSWVRAKKGEIESARDLLAQIPAAELERMPDLYGDLGLLCVLAETYYEVDETTRVERVYAQLLPYAELNAVGPCTDYHGSVAHYLGLLALLRGDCDEAAARFERAAKVNRNLGMPIQAARSRALHAEAVKRRPRGQYA